MSRDVHKVQIRLADELNFRGVKETIVIFTDEARVFNCFLGEVVDVGLGADDADVVVMFRSSVERDVLTDQHTDSNTGHVEAVEEGLDRVVDLHSLLFPFVFVDAESHGGDDGIMTVFDVLEELGEAVVVVNNLRRPVAAVIYCYVVSSEGVRGIDMKGFRNSYLPPFFPFSFVSHGLLRYMPGCTSGFGVVSDSCWV